MESVGFQGEVSVDIRESSPDWAPYRGATAPAGAPNVLYLLWDDTGIATWDCYGGLVEMPALGRIADRGIRLSQFHTTALCSPTRAALLTGRNPTSVGVASVLNLANGYPGHHGRIPAESALLSEVLGERGWSTYAVGKWHLAPVEDCHAAGSRQYWPLRRGFDRFYGFLDGMTDQWYPSLVRDNQLIDPPATPEQGYHLSKDLADTGGSHRVPGIGAGPILHAAGPGLHRAARCSRCAVLARRPLGRPGTLHHRRPAALRVQQRRR